ncbi:DUF960 family protein [Oscillospiraceae bacterium PP1C4]
MFNNPRYMTKGISERLPLSLQIILWGMIDGLKQKQQLDYLQVFTLSATHNDDGVMQQSITHTQEIPPYQMTVTVACKSPVSYKVFCIDDKIHSTMLFADEY